MSATYTARGRINKQAYASNAEAWGTELNQGALDRLDDMWGVVEVTVGADVTLTSENAISDQSRSVVLILSGAGGFNVTAPAVDKPYLVVNNCTADVDILPNAGTSATVRAGKASWYYTNAAGTIGYVIDPTLSDLKAATASIDAGSQLINNVADGVSDNDAVNKSQLDGLLNLTPISEVAAIDTQVAAVAAIDTHVTTVAGISTDVSTVSTNDANVTIVADNIDDILTAASALDPYASQAEAEAGTATDRLMSPLRTKEAIDALASPLGYVEVTGDLTLEAGKAYRLRNTVSDTLTLPGSPSDGDTIRVLDSGVISLTIQPVLDPLTNNINGNSGTLTIDTAGIDFEIWFNGSEWRLR